MEKQPKTDLLEKYRPVIKKMPDRLTLEAFLLQGDVLVYFDTERGEFVWYDPNDKKELEEILMMGQPRTEYGRKLQNMR